MESNIFLISRTWESIFWGKWQVLSSTISLLSLATDLLCRWLGTEAERRWQGAGAVGEKGSAGSSRDLGRCWWTYVGRDMFRVLFALEPLTLCRIGRVPPVVWSGMWNGLELMIQIERCFWRLHWTTVLVFLALVRSCLVCGIKMYKTNWQNTRLSVAQPHSLGSQVMLSFILQCTCSLVPMH